jgi:hypothetical protein
MTSASDKKGYVSIVFFSVQKQVVIQRGQIWRREWVIKTLEAQIGQFLLGCKCPVSRHNVVRAVFFLPNVLQLQQKRSVILHVDSLALWKIINDEGGVFTPKNRGKNFSSGFLHLEFFGAG